MQQIIAIQGFEGSFHQEAAIKYFGKDIQFVCCSSFRDLIKAAAQPKETTAALMAIENSIAGSILPNYTLLQKSNLVITGEVYLQIRQQLVANRGVQLEDIREVHSHPMALLQCTDFLDKHNFKLVETEDTALSAKQLVQRKSVHHAAIAGKLAAELYNLDIIAPNIHTQKNNYTRFLVLQREAAGVTGADKASVSFITGHDKGSLAKVLAAIAGQEINLSKLQSMPIPGSHFSYSFHADLEFDDQLQFGDAMKAIGPLVQSLRIFGIYKNGKK